MMREKVHYSGYVCLDEEQYPHKAAEKLSTQFRQEWHSSGLDFDLLARWKATWEALRKMIEIVK